MLLQFNVTNFLSFKNEAVLSLYASKDKTHEEMLLKYDKDAVLPTVAIYGANAAGKSNLHKALTAAVVLIRQSSSLQINQPLLWINPFLMDDDSRDKATRFDFIFTNNGIKYEYGFSADRTNVLEEYLYEYKSAKPSMIFERSNINEYQFTAKTKPQLAKYTEQNSPNKLFLATATSWNCEATKNAYMWFAEMIDTYDSNNLEMMMLDQLDQSVKSGDTTLNKFMLQLLKNADINISDFDYELLEKETNQFPFALPPGLKIDENQMFDGPGVLQERRITTHHIVNQNGIKKEYLLNFDNESNGTRRLFTYGPVLKSALELGRTIIIDEIDNALHPVLTKSLIEMFQNPNINKNGAQLIFNTHEVSLLDLDTFRRDQIYFVEKNSETAESDLYSLDEFSPRKTENIQKGYLQGRYGAIPALNLGDIEW